MHSRVTPENCRADQSSRARSNERGCGQLSCAGIEGCRTEASGQDRRTQTEEVSLFKIGSVVFYILLF